jgi:hypothetical protein
MKCFKLLLLLFICGSCQNSKSQHDTNPQIKNSDLLKIKENYSPKEINYFLETVFYSDGNHQIQKNIRKWEVDILLYIDNGATNEDIKIVNNCVKKINDLKLSIKIKLNNNSKASNVKIYFGDKEYLKKIFVEEGFYGIAKLTDNHGKIKSASIGILDVFRDDHKKREALILEELTQTLGISGDSYSYPESIFYEGNNMPVKFSELDTRICQLLYETSIPINYSLESFKKDFYEELNFVDYMKKIQSLLIEKKIKKETAIKISETCFDNDVFYKHPNSIPIYISGDYNENDIVFLNMAVSAINKLSEHINLYISTKKQLTTESGIYFDYQKKNTISRKVMSKITSTIGHSLSDRVVRNEVNVLFKDEVNIEKVKNRNMIEILYKVLGPIQMKAFSEDWYSISNQEITINEEYKQLMNLIYCDTFITGLKKTEFDEIIKNTYK